MDKLWAPWRLRYITSTKKQGQRCIFCASQRSPKNLVFLKSMHSIALLNAFPYNNGHAMVCPKRHTARIESLTDKELNDLLGSLKRVIGLLDKTLKPRGYNIGMNIGRTAGAGIDQHIHMHIVPRWNGDTNYMPIIGETKVVSQGLLEAYDILKSYFTGKGSISTGD